MPPYSGTLGLLFGDAHASGFGPQNITKHRRHTGRPQFFDFLVERLSGCV